MGYGDACGLRFVVDGVTFWGNPLFGVVGGGGLGLEG